MPRCIELYGLGYVGSVVGLDLAQRGHVVRIHEIDPAKKEAISSGVCPISEPGLQEILDRLRVDHPERLELAGEHSVSSPISIICVGTPSLSDGRVDLGQVESILAVLAGRLRRSQEPHLIVIRSTIPPGSCRKKFIPLMEELTSSRHGERFELVHYPEFLREGQALADCAEPSINCVGAESDRTLPLIRELFPSPKPIKRVSFETSEAIKYVSNSYHALKVAFANELGVFARVTGTDVSELHALFVSDQALNISDAYLSPGFSFGGPCLTKELRAVSATARSAGECTPLVDSVLESNDVHTSRLATLIERLKPTSVGFIGVTFKPETDDLRESPLLDVLTRLQDMASYKRPKRIQVLDGPQALSKLSKKIGTSVETCQEFEPLLETCDLLVLGPFRLRGSQLERIAESRASVIDLKYHRVPGALARSSRYFLV